MFLPVVDNDRAAQSSYKQNFMSLEALVLVHSEVDVILVPRETSLWAFYAPGTRNIVPLRQSAFYQSDTIGLRTLDQRGALHMFNSTCIHEDYKTECFDAVFLKNVLPFLKN